MSGRTQHNIWYFGVSLHHYLESAKILERGLDARIRIRSTGIGCKVSLTEGRGTNVEI